MKPLLSVLLGLSPLAGFAAEGAAATVPRLSGPPKSGDFVFSFLPQAFQRDPTLEMTVNTEVTDYGRLLRPASPEQPVYYQAVAAGFKPLGAPMAGEHPPPPADLERAMKKALAVNGYLARETPGTTPSLLVVYYWGSHNALDRETAKNFPQLAAQNNLERAILVGGKKYAAHASHVMEWGPDILDRQATQEFLREQMSDDVYYVVASAYDYVSVAHGDRKLAWRTSMTVATHGVSMSDTLVPLVVTAAPFFGHETKEPEIDVRKVPRKTHIEVGTPTVVDANPPKR